MEVVLVGRLHTAGSILVSILSDELVEVLHHAPSLYQSWAGRRAIARGIFDGGRIGPQALDPSFVEGLMMVRRKVNAKGHLKHYYAPFLSSTAKKPTQAQLNPERTTCQN